MTDPIADMLTRIRNAINAQQNEVTMPHSKLKQAVAELLVKSGFLESTKASGDKPSKQLTIVINNKDENARITEISRMSKPGRRYYVGVSEIPTVKNGRGIVIVSTSNGLMTGNQAKKKGVGGELICKVY